jgi:hypothetical protein
MLQLSLANPGLCNRQCDRARAKLCSKTAFTASSVCPTLPLQQRYADRISGQKDCNLRATSNTATSTTSRTSLDEFVGSTPAVEQAVRSFARNVERLRQYATTYTEDVQFDVGSTVMYTLSAFLFYSTH